MGTFGRSLMTAAMLAAVGVASGAEAPARLDDRYRETANRILAAALADDGAWNKLSYLCDHIGHRISGSPQLERAVAWAAEHMKADGLENVRLQPVKVPHWVRGREGAEVVEPVRKPLAMLGLGLSVGTPPEGITAPVVAVRSYDELEALGREKVSGKLVLYDVAWQGYGRTVEYRRSGPSRAAKLGAVGVLLRSVASYSLYTPHTGLTEYEADAPKIPAAAITVEDAAWIGRLVREGVEVKVKLQMEAQRLPDADSANVIGEIRGSERPDEVVVIGGHIDSWDVGQGANDDGAGTVVSMQALALLHRLGLRPRRTIRVVLFTAEEQGIHGGEAYHKAMVDAKTVGNHVAAIEADSGGERPVGFSLGLPALKGRPEEAVVKQRALEELRQIGALLGQIEAGDIRDGGGGPDIEPMEKDGMPGLGLRTAGERYFYWHHTNADTLDKIEPENLRRQVAAMAVMAYILADMPDRLVEQSSVTTDAHFDLESELERIRRELQRNPDSAFWHQQAATVYSALRNYQSAESEIQKAIELEPKNPMMCYTAAALYQHQGRKDKEKEFVWKALEMDSRNPFGNAWLGDLYATEGKWSWAVTQYELASRFLNEDKGDSYYVDDSGKEDYVDNHGNYYTISDLRRSLPRLLEEARKRVEAGRREH